MSIDEIKWGPWTVNNPEDIKIDPYDGVLREVFIKHDTPCLYGGQHFSKTHQKMGLACWKQFKGYNHVLMYREEIEPKRVTLEGKVLCHLKDSSWSFNPSDKNATHIISFDTVDNEPILESIKMREIK